MILVYLIHSLLLQDIHSVCKDILVTKHKSIVIVIAYVPVEELP